MALQYRPYERQTLQNLLASINHGLGGSEAYSILQGVQSAAAQRQAAQQQHRQGLQALLPQMAQFAGTVAQSGLPEGVLQSAYGGYKSPIVQGALGQLVSSLGPWGTGASAYSQATPAPPPSTQLDAEDQAAIWTDAVTNLQAGRSPWAVQQIITLKYGPALAGHEQEVQALIQQAMAATPNRPTLGEAPTAGGSAPAPNWANAPITRG